MEPPFDCEMTEVDSADEDEATVSVNKLSGRQLSAAAVCTIKKPDECVILGSHDNKDVEADDVDEEEEQAEEEDDEEDVQAAVLATRAKRPATSKTRTVRKKTECVAAVE